MRRKIYVTAAEMRTLRESGMSNRDIAMSLDVSEQTVRRYIGRQEGHMESLKAFDNSSHRKKDKTQALPELPKYEPKPVLEKYQIGGFILELDGTDRYVMISGDSGDIVFQYESVPDLVQFLVWAMRERMGSGAQ